MCHARRARRLRAYRGGAFTASGGDGDHKRNDERGSHPFIRS
jgi:hypothetical protein